MSTQLTVHNAEIKTAAVEIKALTVSGRQVTQSVFRQLKETPLVTDGGHFAGLPWGSINYHPDKCADYSEHLHVVWQKDQELRRARFHKPKFEHWGCEAADAFLTSSVRDWIRGQAKYWDGGCPLGSRDIGRKHFTADFITLRKEHVDVVVYMNPAASAADAANAVVGLDEAHKRLIDNPKSEWRQSELSNAKAMLVSDLESLDLDCARYNATTEELFREYRDALDGEASRRARHKARWSEVNDLPQLFIAV